MRAVDIIGVGMIPFGKHLDKSLVQMGAMAAIEAIKDAGVKPSDINIGFFGNMHLEGLGLCPVGEGGRLVESGATRIGGKMPVNTSGGLLSKGHPPGATAVSQLVEGVLQLRGEAGPRQVEGAKTFLAECMGAEKNGDAKSCTVNILQK